MIRFNVLVNRAVLLVMMGMVGANSLVVHTGAEPISEGVVINFTGLLVMLIGLLTFWTFYDHFENGDTDD